MSRFFVVPLFAADRCASGGHAAHFLYSMTMLMPTSTAFWGLVSKQIKCDKAYSLNFKPLPIKNRQAPFKPNFFILLSPQPPAFRIPPGTSPPSEGLGEAPSQDLFSHPYPTVSSHIPSSGGAWGGFICQFLSLPFFNLRPFAF